MIRYRYADNLSPPAPFVNVVLRNPKSEYVTGETPAQLDVGADRTVIPRRAADALHLNAVRRITVAGLGGDLHTLDVFLLSIQIHDLQPMVIEVVAHDDEPFVLLGRDILNHLRIV